MNKGNLIQRTPTGVNNMDIINLYMLHQVDMEEQHLRKCKSGGSSDFDGEGSHLIR